MKYHKQVVLIKYNFRKTLFYDQIKLVVVYQQDNNSTSNVTTIDNNGNINLTGSNIK